MGQPSWIQHKIEKGLAKPDLVPKYWLRLHVVLSQVLLCWRKQNMIANAPGSTAGALSWTSKWIERAPRHARTMNFMKTHAAISAILLTLISGIAGYLLRAHKTDGSLVLSVRDVVKEEYLVPPDSFSRVENTKNALDGLCTRLRLGIQESTAAYDRLASNGGTSNSQAAVVLERAIRDAETAMREFEGTEPQLEVLQDYLRLLERAGRFDLWTQFYLKAMYEHPAHAVVSRLAKEALRIGELAGEQDQVLEALRYLSARPEEFAGRTEIQAALSSAQPYLARVEGHPERGSLAGGGNDPLMK
jgi:hypothetical protein